MKSKYYFSLLEVITAIAILAGSLTVLLTYTTNSQSRLLKTQKQWQDFHLLEQAAEFYLLTIDKEPESPPDFVFTSDKYSVECFYRDPEDIPEDFEMDSGQAPLTECCIRIIENASGKTVHELCIDRFDYEQLQNGGI